MFTKEIILVCLLCFGSVKCKDNNILNALASFLVQDDRPTSLLIPNLCWDPYQLRLMARQLMGTGISVAESLQKNRHEFYLQHLVVMVDLACPEAEDFLMKANRNGYLKSPYRWLILNLHNGSNSNVLSDITMLVDSDVVIVKKLGDGIYGFIEVYRLAENTELIFTTRSVWQILKTNNKIETDTAIGKPNEITRDVTVMNNEKVAKENKGVLKDYRASKVLYSRRSNLNRHTLTMANVITDSNETQKHLDDRLYLHQDSITKMSYTVVKICFEMLNATEKLIFTHTWGYKDKHGNWQGIIDHLVKKEADLGTLTIFTQERMQMIDYIAMVGSTKVRFVFREPPLSYISNIFTQPFTTAVWLAIVVCVLGCSVFLYITSRWEASISMHQFQLNGSWADVIILIIGGVLQQGCTLEPRYAAGRTVTLLLYLALTILYAAYSANIVVLLRAPSSSVRTLSDLLHSPLKLGASDFEYNRYFFKKLNDPIRKAIYDKKIAPRGKRPNFYPMKEGVERIRRGLFAFHMESNPGYRLIQETYQEDEKCDLVEIDYINEINPWVPGQKRSPFKDHFKINFNKIRESGIQACIHHRLHVPRPRCSGAVSAFSSVGITDMYPAMLATVYMTLLAPTVLLLEIAYHRLSSINSSMQSTPRGYFNGTLIDTRPHKELFRRRKDLMGHPLTMANVIQESNDTKIHLLKEDRLDLHHDAAAKLCWIAAKHAFEMLNATPRYVFSYRWGYKVNGQWSGMIDDIRSNRADLGTNCVLFTNRLEFVTYTDMVATLRMRFIFRQPPLTSVSNIFSLPFSTSVWIAIVICVAASTVTLYCTSKWEASLGTSPAQLDGSVGDALLLTLSAVAQQGCFIEPRRTPGRIMEWVLFTALMALYAAYSANIVVLLQAPSKSIRTLDHLASSKLTIAALDVDYNRFVLNDSTDLAHITITERLRPEFYNIYDGVQRIRQGMFALHSVAEPIFRRIEETFLESEKCDISVVDYVPGFNAFTPVKKDSPYLEVIRVVYKQIRESGIQAALNRRMLVPQPRCFTKMAAFSSVGLLDLWPVLIFMLYGIVFSIIILFAEIVCYKIFEKSKKKNIRNKITMITMKY